MEEMINIAKILKNKPKGTRLYSTIFGECAFSLVREETDDICVKKHNGVKEFFDSKGLYDAIGECLLFPSREMRDWSKFAWKKGDVLVTEDGSVHIIFEKFEDDAYTMFSGKYYYSKDGKKAYSYFKECDNVITEEFTLETEDAAQTYISAIEERLGGKLNLQSLEIEKQPEFKDGDIVVYKCEIDDVPSTIFIFRGIDQHTPYYSYYASLDSDGYLSYKLGEFGIYNRELRLATEEEKQQLFDALEKEGKAWDAEKKEFIDLKPKVEFKPFDKVLCRNSKDDTWEADFFARLTRKEIDYTQSGKYLCVGDLWMYCIPYNEETAHLLGTTDDWEGGEHD